MAAGPPQGSARAGRASQASGPLYAAWGSLATFPAWAHPASPGPISPAYSSEVGLRESLFGGGGGGGRIGQSVGGATQDVRSGLRPRTHEDARPWLGLEESAQGGPTAPRDRTSSPGGVLPRLLGLPLPLRRAPCPPKASVREGGAAMARKAGQDPTSLRGAHPGHSGGRADSPEKPPLAYTPL